MQGLFDVMKLSYAVLVRDMILIMFTDAIKREDWEMLGLMISAWEQVKIDAQVKKANEYLKLNPTEIILA